MKIFNYFIEKTGLVSICQKAKQASTSLACRVGNCAKVISDIYKRETVNWHIQRMPFLERATLNNQALFPDGVFASEKCNIVWLLFKVHDPIEREKVIEQSLSLMNKKMNGEEREAIVRTLIDLPKGDREEAVTKTKNLLKEAMNGYERAELLYLASRIILPIDRNILDGHLFVMGDIHIDKDMRIAERRLINLLGKEGDIVLLEEMGERFVALDPAVNDIEERFECYGWDCFLDKVLYILYAGFKDKLEALDRGDSLDKSVVEKLQILIKKGLDKRRFLRETYLLQTIRHFQQTAPDKKIFVICGETHLENILEIIEKMPHSYPLFFKSGKEDQTFGQYPKSLINAFDISKEHVSEEVLEAVDRIENVDDLLKFEKRYSIKIRRSWKEMCVLFGSLKLTGPGAAKQSLFEMGLQTNPVEKIKFYGEILVYVMGLTVALFALRKAWNERDLS